MLYFWFTNPKQFTKPPRTDNALLENRLVQFHDIVLSIVQRTTVQHSLTQQKSCDQLPADR